MAEFEIVPGRTLVSAQMGKGVEGLLFNLDNPRNTVRHILGTRNQLSKRLDELTGKVRRLVIEIRGNMLVEPSGNRKIEADWYDARERYITSEIEVAFLKGSLKGGSEDVGRLEKELKERYSRYNMMIGGMNN